MNNCSEIVKQYVSWIESQFDIINDANNDACIISTPYQTEDGDHIDIKIIKHGNSFYLSDLGETTDTLYLKGIDLTTKGRKEIIDLVMSDFQAEMINGEITMSATTDNLAWSIQKLIQTIKSVNYLVYTGRIKTPKTFRDEVLNYLKENHVVFQRDYIIKGKISEHPFDLYIQKKYPVVFRTLSTTSQAYARTLSIQFLYSIIDIRETKANIKTHPFVDDREENQAIWVGEPINILESYTDAVVYWSKREKALELIAA